MLEQNNTDSDKQSADPESISPLIEAHINQQIQNAIERYEKSQSKVKRWRNSWRSASPITKATFLMTTAITVATISYAIAAWRTLTVMRNIAADSGTQTQQLIDAALQMKTAGYEFSGAAIGINNAMWNAFGQLKLQEQQMETARKASNLAAQKSLEMAQAQMRLDERAWMGASNPSFVLDINRPISAATHITAYGKSPAVDVQTNMGLMTFPAGYQPRVDELIFKDAVFKEGTVAPGSNFVVWKIGDVPMTDKDRAIVNAIAAQRWVLFFFGETKFQDIFGVQHWTHFCYIASATSSNPNDARPCGFYNDTDADYQQGPKDKK